MGRMEGKVAFITGAARGQGRAHAIRLAGEGADIIVTDIAGPVDTVSYPSATPEDLAETVKEVEALDRRVVSFVADVRDHDALAGGLAAGVEELGGLDVVVANAGIINAVRPSWELDEADWQTMLDVNLTGVWHATKAAVPHLIERGPGGSVILISSTAGLRGIPGIAHYNAAKHGVLGLARTLANELAPHRIRVNSVHPTNVRTTMIDNPSSAKIYRPDLENPTFEDSLPALADINMWDEPYLDVEDVANAVLFLACDESRYVTGIALPVDLGMSMKYSGA
ncbi:(+)-trans-carveol dehydrogenase [Pseudonocardia hierapolitana]|uniref:(+)-trans-carveol dehydrogenase n=1 Tax=Pseudonocardia hierapolitana TaxID=1128676 RepID=A0A561T4J4_9PSEU|nr:(+)-trans-carveol dehydrogenase [Pseudonocardia hierapolitana]